MDRLADMPGQIIHGRYDMVCPLDNATLLHQSWPGSELCIVREAGHFATEPAITDCLVKATDEIGRDLSPVS